MLQEATLALLGADQGKALRQLIEIAVRYQLRRPRLAVLLDIETDRLAALMPRSGNAVAMHAALCNFLSDYLGASSLGSSAPEPACAASDVMAMISALTDVAGRRGTMHPAKLSDGIEGAVLGYLGLKR